MARRRRLTEGKRNIIAGLIEEYNCPVSRLGACEKKSVNFKPSVV